jgi:hypothetical protein
VVINPSLGIDGATGRRIWTLGSARSILKTSDGSNSPRALAGPDGTTICRVAMPTSADGRYRVAPGVTSRPPTLDVDPRRERRLPWFRPVEPYADPSVQVALAATLINICIPLAILWLATRRRFWSVRLLLALPAVVAILLTGDSALISLNLASPELTETRGLGKSFGVILLLMGDLAIAVYATAFVLSLVRVRWLKWLLALPIVVAILVTGYMALIAPILPILDRPQSTVPRWWDVFVDVAALSLTGLPIVALAAVFGSALVRRRWRKIGRLVAGSLLTAVLIGTLVPGLGSLMKPLIEHF